MSEAAVIDSPAFHVEHFRAARLVCRQRFPDIFFASHLLSRVQRHDLYVLSAVVGQLLDLLRPAEPCQTCGPQDQARAVCAALLDHLFSGEPTGRADLDGFAAVVSRLTLPRPVFDSFIEGVADQRTIRRFPTWARLRTHLNQSAGSAAVLAAHALAENKGTGVIFPATREDQWRAWGVALALIDAISHVGQDWRDGRLVVPLDDLVRFGINEQDIARFSAAEKGDDRWRRLLMFQRERIHDLLTGGQGAIAALSSESSRRAAALFTRIQQIRLERLLRSPHTGFAKPVVTTSAMRWRALPALLARESKNGKGKN